MGLLGVLCANLIVCSLERFPGVWRQITMDGLTVPDEHIKRKKLQGSWTLPLSLGDSAELLQKRLCRLGWNSSLSHDGERDVRIFSQKGAYSRAGVYSVHSSILLIVLGAVIGSFLGFRGNVMIPVDEETGVIFVGDGRSTMDLGFTLRCESFDIEFYPDGMVKDYRSRLTVIASGREQLSKEIEVNAPLKYRGITFYQATYEGYNEFQLQLNNIDTDEMINVIIPFQKEQQWQQENLSFGIINGEVRGQSVIKVKVWLSNESDEPVTVWLDDGQSKTVQLGSGRYLLRVKQMYGTGLQVTKDPGVWLVYLGCLLMVVGLVLSFFISHRRIWLLLQGEGEGTSVFFAGGSNKNRSEFEKQFSVLFKKLQDGSSRRD